MVVMIYLPETDQGAKLELLLLSAHIDATGRAT